MLHQVKLSVSAQSIVRRGLNSINLSTLFSQHFAPIVSVSMVTCFLAGFSLQAISLLILHAYGVYMYVCNI